MKKTLIVRIAEGLGNQLFMYANAYSLSKKFGYSLYIDDESGFSKNKRSRSYNLDFFNIPEQLCPEQLKFNNFIKNFKRKSYKFIDNFISNKKFIIEKVDENKQTKFEEISKLCSIQMFIEGHYESELYFKDYEKDLKKILKIKYDLIDKNNSYINQIIQSNSVSIHLRKNRFSEDLNNQKTSNNEKNILFEKNLVEYVNRSIKYFDNKLENPHYFIWSNEPNEFKNFFLDSKKFTFVENNNLIMDFHLFSLCKNFIVGPSTFHWWGAWLNENTKKVCLRPKNINPSNNTDFWPKYWVSI
tara:strand:+ start:86 stop:985 length:900 start_codon:yes stop_codon:yes gene_type:complete